METRLPYKMELNLFRIVQELVNNTLKHSNADQINLKLTKSDSHILLFYFDNGNGILENQTSDGIGLKNIRTRIAHLHPESQLYIQSENGFELRIIIPLI